MSKGRRDDKGGHLFHEKNKIPSHAYNHFLSRCFAGILYIQLLHGSELVG
jgi:hypothetical protein